MGGGNVDHQETVRPFVRAAEYLEARPPIKPSKVSPFEGVCKKRHPGAGQNCPHGNHVGSLHDCRVGNSGTPYSNFPQDFTPKQMIEEVARGRFSRNCHETRSAYE
jgi:hypothetical protein